MNFAQPAAFGADEAGSASYALALGGANQSATPEPIRFAPGAGGWSSDNITSASWPM